MKKKAIPITLHCKHTNLKRAEFGVYRLTKLWPSISRRIDISAKILITGATSEISKQIIHRLQQHGHALKAMVRNPEKAAHLESDKVALVQGDLEKPQTLKQCFEGIDVVFALTPPGPRAPEQFSNGLWAARQAGVKRIVRLSAFGAAHDAPTINGRLHALSDSELIASGIEYTILKPHFFMQNLFMAAQGVAEHGVLALPLKDGRMSLIDTRDISDVAATVLVENGHKNKVYTLTGPESLNMTEVAKPLSQSLGKAIQYDPISLDDAMKHMASSGMDEFTLNVLHDYFAAYSVNWGDVTTSAVKDLTGSEPRDISQFFNEFSGVFSRKQN